MKNNILSGLVVVISLFTAEFSQAQKVGETTYMGEAVFVYPYKTELTFHSNYFNALKGGFSKKTSMKSWFIAMNGGVFDRKMYKEYKNYFGSMNSRLRNSENKHTLTKKFKKAVRKNPYPLLERKYTLDKDVIPSLDRIPDGRYIQYFDTFPLIKLNGKSENIGNRISGIFNIKDNLLEGEAIWLNVDGDTLKKGVFKKGMKEGEWMLESRRTEYSLTKANAKQYIELGYPKMDTTIEFVAFSNGVMNGHYRKFENSQFPTEEGYFKDNKPEGEWLERQVSYTGKGAKRIRNRDNSVITFRYTSNTDTKLVKTPIIRFKQIPNLDYFYDESFIFESKYTPNIPFSRLYRLGGEELEESIELEEEDVSSYEGGSEDELLEDEYYEEDYGYSNDYVRQQYDYKSGKYLTYPKLIDSLGIVFNYRGIYEKRYPNGQLMVRYNFQDGSLLEEDTIFWDNGKAFDVITFERDSNQFFQTIYDYTGALYKQIVFDSIGDFVRVNFETSTLTYLEIDGYKAEFRDPSDKYFFYDKLDTLSNELSDSLVIFRSWYVGDTSLLYTRSYSPEDRKLNFQLLSVKGTPSIDAEMIFAEDFESWTGTKHYNAGKLNVQTTSSASYVEYYPLDSFPQRNVNEFSELYNITDHHMLYNDGVAFSGDVTIEFNKKKFKLDAEENSIHASFFSNTSKKQEKLQKDINNFRLTGKTKNELLVGIIDASEADEEYCEGIYYNLFGSFIAQYLEYPYLDYDYENDFQFGKKISYPYAKKITGKFEAGKPAGTWEARDQHGRLLMEIPFMNGEVEGTFKTYDFKSPSYEDYYMEEDPGDTFPKKMTYYLYSTEDYRKGLRNGKSTTYNWLGEVTAEENYLDGFLDGKAFERNKLAYTSMTYSQGALDGYVRTYLTLPEQDSVLLFNLNFQNGLLQGESKSFHTNGKVAKKGFFLNGQAIDDYEAFDTLGFKYHYVKFQYSFPVEEKIWEENELSVRYLFDWRDSIIFEPSDITSTQSLDRVLYGLGIGTDYLERPYYGRPSLIEKRGIDYQMTKYYPNDTIARDGSISKGKKVGCWSYFSYDGEFLYEVDYMDSVLTINDSVQFKSKGILTDYDAAGNKLSESYIIEKFEKYDCSHTDHYEIRQLKTIWEASDTLGRMNGYAKNYYDNGVLQNEGMMKDGLPTGVWKFYDPYGKLNLVGEYILGKRDGRWLGGDLSKTKYLGDICLNPNLPNIEEEIKYREKLLDIVITNYRMGKALNKEFYDVNLNNYESDTDTEQEIEGEMEEEGEEH